ncbi:Tetratricopeptide repeat protein (plasmid) [Rhodovastum atsumiense]|uniref:tetratricopeptide repeat-containing glycosyltransferase family protein n=1 Tax=Rhodovastum atsumiense TaxID=504468 RepID=UPI0020247ECD|nr:tetratricopeptide repeat-containing glycosyltransferase family protein [Rhodovastum atsumiense]CAH2605604.1 Tetratricopeptide repeat protein [Rhodovastum atsumiense]
MKRHSRQTATKQGRPGLRQPALSAEAVFAEASRHHQAGYLDEAEHLYRQVLAIESRHADSLNRLGTIAWQRGHHDRAIDLIGRAIAIDGENASFHSTLGAVLDEQGRPDAAIASFCTALRLRPNYPEVLNDLGNVLLKQARPEQAAACYRLALEITPDNPGAYSNLGKALQEQGHPEEAFTCFQRAIALAPDLPDARHNRAMALLARGDMAAGWQEYEWRWRTPQMTRFRRDFPQPQWQGEAAPGQTLLIHAEQGFGDTLQFCRYASLAAARGLRVIMEVQPPLLRLLRDLPDVDRVVARGEELPQFDLHCPMLSLPFALGTTLATIPGDTPYLHADATQVVAWKARLAATVGQRQRIGLVWAGNPRAHLAVGAALDRHRSIPPERLASLLDLPGRQFFSLQKDGPAAPAGLGLIDHMAEMKDFADTAALVVALDMVISVDTAVAHLAAALGRPVWLLDRFNPCWRWLLGRRDSPWYPTLRIYRQPRPGDWDAVLTEVARDLGNLGQT